MRAARLRLARRAARNGAPDSAGADPRPSSCAAAPRSPTGRRSRPRLRVGPRRVTMPAGIARNDSAASRPSRTRWTKTRPGRAARAAKVLHVHRRLVAPARLATLRGVRLVDGADRLAEGLAGPQPRATASGATIPVAQRRQPRRSSRNASASVRSPWRWASCGTKYDSSGTASSQLRSSITRSSVVPDRRTPRTSGGGVTAANDESGGRVVADHVDRQHVAARPERRPQPEVRAADKPEATTPSPRRST